MDIENDPTEMKSLSNLASSKSLANPNLRIAEHALNDGHGGHLHFLPVIVTCVPGKAIVERMFDTV
jgi:hypothetical protein